MLAANKFELEELSKKLETILIKEKACMYPNLIFDAGDFTSLQESALVSLLKRDDIQMEEGKIWEYTIHQNKENFLTLKNTLQQCLPHIRYFHIPGDDIWNKVEPYKKILDKQLWKNPELPTRIKEPFSTIISDEHAAEVSSWIDHKIPTYSSTNCPYEFRMLLRGSIDGFNPLMWDNTTSGAYKETKDSFIFSLRNDYQNKRGSNFGGSALHMHSTSFNFTMDNKSFCSNYSFYEKQIGTTTKKFSKSIRTPPRILLFFNLYIYPLSSFLSSSIRYHNLLKMALKFFDTLSQNFTKLLNDKDDYNVIIEVEDKKKFTAHSNVLKCRSPYFRKELDTINPNENNVKTIIKPKISAQILDIILKYIYGGFINLENVESRIIFDLMLTANEFKFEELSKKLETILIEDKASWLKSHFSFVYHSIFLNNNFKDLENFCNDIVAKYPNLIFDSDDFTSLQESALVSLLKRDDIQMEEGKIWEYTIKYIYGGFINLENVESRIIFDLMLTANEFKFEELSKKLETILIEDKASWLKSHFSFVYHSIFLNNNFKDLENFCNDIVAKYPNLIFDSDDFTSLQESALVSLLKRDDIQMEEGKIWEYTIKWGISQNPTLPTNLEEWNKENFLTLKITLQQCLPYIRFFHISGDDILDKVKPYKKILDKQLWEDLMQQFISSDRPIKSVILPARSVLIPELPTRVKEPFSTIISDEHAAEISSWIDRKTTAYPSTNYSYEFQLILRGSKDGFSPPTFWNMCHGHTGTVVIIKVKGTDEILGGYNPLMWDNTKNDNTYTYMHTNDSFIFSLKNGNIQNSILSRVSSPQYALVYYGKSYQNSYGPNFGGGSLYMYSSVSNFTTNNESYSNYSGHYEKQIRTTNRFSIVDYEVFKVNKKTT
ncbi:hypothetical protein Glove_9g181 [Diversispora epigaea]|uniref:BTB domain-containing protein n=1 Tax=Diversispora epigaea TaxID=1348612 RepID=A0A397JNF6_9GLOM|nr:hypothetical protein Glove_9g181 [Diversispora epigaea]